MLIFLYKQKIFGKRQTKEDIAKYNSHDSYSTCYEVLFN